MAKVVCVLYDDPVSGMPKTYARDTIPHIEGYPGGQTAPTPRAIDFKPGQLLGCVSGELGLRKYLESLGHQLVVTSDKDGPNSVFERELADAEVVISQPFWPAYLEPDASHVIGLVASSREPQMPLTRELFAVAGQVDVAAEIERHIARHWPAITTAGVTNS
jgi:formate dehydrogenase